MKNKHYLVILNEKAVACCDDKTKEEQLKYYQHAQLVELEEGELCPICSEEEEG